jgi:regulator of protease activity HflC (stomatin/prohibitin superfamily)
MARTHGLESAGTSDRLFSADSLAGATLFLVALGLLIGRGLTVIRPNDAIILLFFGAYHGTVRTTGFRWCNPLAKRTKISLKARNLVSDQLKVNDKRGNPIEIAAVVVWRIADTAQKITTITFASKSNRRFVSSHTITTKARKRCP